VILGIATKKSYDRCSSGGGISVGALRLGRVIDVNNALVVDLFHPTEPERWTTLRG
jgi:butyrate kinase